MIQTWKDTYFVRCKIVYRVCFPPHNCLNMLSGSLIRGLLENLHDVLHLISHLLTIYIVQQTALNVKGQILVSNSDTYILMNFLLCFIDFLGGILGWYDKKR